MSANLLTIPAGTPASRCRGCGQLIFWVKTVTGKSMPVSIAQDGATAPSPSHDGRGSSHFADCPQAAQFRRSDRVRSSRGDG